MCGVAGGCSMHLAKCGHRQINIVHSEGRKPRLVVDSSICGTNACCMIPEKCSLPTLQTIQAGFPLRNRHEPLAAWSLDVKSAHKSIRVRDSEQGLLGIRVRPKLYFYTVVSIRRYILCILVRAPGCILCSYISSPHIHCALFGVIC